MSRERELDPEAIWARWNSQRVRRPGPGNPLQPYAGDEQPAEPAAADAHQRAIEETAARDELLRRVQGEGQSDG